MTTAVVLVVTGAGRSSPVPGVAEVDDAARIAGYLSATATDVAAVSGYDYRHLSEALAAGSSVTTGAYARAYRAALTGATATTARAQHVVQSLTLQQTAIGRFDDHQAQVLLFGTEHVASSGGTVADPIVLTATVVDQDGGIRIADLVAGARTGLPAGSAGLAAAADAARRELSSLLTLRRAGFTADRAAALDAIANGPLRTELATSLDAERVQLDKGRYDVQAAAPVLAVEAANGSAAQFLAQVTVDRVAGDSARSTDSDGRYEISVEYASGRWQVTELVQVPAAS